MTIRIFSLPDGKVETQTGTGEVVPVDYSSNVASVVDEVRSSIVRINGVSSGSGVIYAQAEETVYVVTAYENAPCMAHIEPDGKCRRGLECLYQ